MNMPNVLLTNNNNNDKNIEWNGLKSSQISNEERKTEFFFLLLRHLTGQECFVENLKTDK